MRMLKWWTICGCLLLVQTVVFAQGNSIKTQVPNGWHLMDKEQDGFYGISLDKAYEFLRSKNLKSKTVLVAVIDSGVDTLHEDLQGILWTNPREIPGNGIDDDHNGYVDDIHGWNFLGGKDGRNVKDDASEAIRVYYQYKNEFDNKHFDSVSLDPEEKQRYEMWSKAKKKVMGDGSDTELDLGQLNRLVRLSKKSDTILQQAMGKPEYTGEEMQEFVPKSPEAKSAKSLLTYLFKQDKIASITNKDFMSEFVEYAEGEIRKAEAKEKAPENYRAEIVQDDESNIDDRYYGNNDVMAVDPLHGTHVSGIIGAARDNGKGINGVADNVKIMMIRALPNGDEHDKDIALAIRYAVDNGAKVINMSFGKAFSPEKDWVDDAVLYADKKGVLLVHAAGNENANIDSTDNFPNAIIQATGTRAPNFITVGASSEINADADFKSYTASFSNYGKDQVDVFAPGVKIYSTLPGNRYGIEQGTSMSSPVVTGVAALILEYFPNLTPEQVKYCIDHSAVVPPSKVIKPGSTDKWVDLSDLSITGGVINAYAAVKLAATITSEQPKKEGLPKSTLIRTRN